MKKGIEQQAIPPLREWWKTQAKIKHISELASAVGTNRVSVRHWLSGRAFPRDNYCDRLFEITGLGCFSPDGRNAARAEHRRLIPLEVKRNRRINYSANQELFRKRSLESWRRRYQKRRRFVKPEELEVLRKDPRRDKNVCRECGEILHDVGPHLRPRHRMQVAEYKEKWGFLRSRNATRSETTNQRQSDSMKRRRHQPPNWTRTFLPKARASSLRTNCGEAARLEKRLNARGKKLGARPQEWKRTSSGNIVRDAEIAQLRLSGKSVPEIAATTGLAVTPVFLRLCRMGFPKRARAFLHGEPVGWHHVETFCADFELTSQDVAQLLGISHDWVRRKVRSKRKIEWLALEPARKFLKVRKELLAQLKNKPASPQGGRPRQLPPSAKLELAAKYDALRVELKIFRVWLKTNLLAPRGAAWDWLCGQFRSGSLPTLQFWPQFFRWLEKDFTLDAFRQASWTPRDLAIQFLAHDYQASEDTVAHAISHASSVVRRNSEHLWKRRA